MAMKSLFPILAVLALAGCASYTGRGLAPGATEAEVRATMGNPVVVYPNADGSRRLAYPKGPYGTETYMADIGPDGRLVSVHNALNDDTFYRVRPGMHRDEVLHLIGPPSDSMAFPRQGHYALDWRFVDTWGYTAIFSVTFDGRDIVVSKISQRLERERKGL
jgi:hypothetical protein